MSKRISILLFAVLVFPAILWAAMPEPTGFVTDAAGVLDQGTKSNLEGFLTSFERETGIEVAVATVPTLDERPVEDYAVDMFQRWGIGKKNKNNGALFIVAPNERKMRIEVGYGLEGAINDALAGRILDSAVIPKFKEGDLSGGIAAGTLAIVDTIVAKENLNFDAGKATDEHGLASARSGDDGDGGPLSVVGKLLVLLVLGYLFIRHPWLFLFFLSSGVGRGRAGGGFSGGFGGFGGGMSGGGGASRGW